MSPAAGNNHNKIVNTVDRADKMPIMARAGAPGRPVQAKENKGG
jgi:hypothetical protein